VGKYLNYSLLVVLDRILRADSWEIV